MTQQINLYSREVEEKKGPLLMTGLGLVALAVVLVAYGFFIRAQSDRMEARIKQTSAQLDAEKAAVKTMKDALAQRMDPTRLAAELAALRNRAAESQEIVDRLRKGELGTLDGFGNHFTAFATIGEPGVWLTAVRIQNAGRAIEVEGRSLREESVLRYAAELNRHVVPFGANIRDVEMTPAVNPQKATAYAFKLF